MARYRKVGVKHLTNHHVTCNRKGTALGWLYEPTSFSTSILVGLITDPMRSPFPKFMAYDYDLCSEEFKE